MARSKLELQAEMDAFEDMLAEIFDLTERVQCCLLELPKQN